MAERICINLRDFKMNLYNLFPMMIEVHYCFKPVCIHETTVCKTVFVMYFVHVFKNCKNNVLSAD